MNPDPTEVFPDAVTVTSTSPGVVAAGIVAVISVGDTTFTLEAATEPKFTEDAPETKLLPIIVAVPPPARDEESGVMEVIVVAVVVRIIVPLELYPTASQDVDETQDTP
jgi:hypothetical protein